MASRISVVIPTYNRAALITETLNCVLVQTRAPDEVIVVDDGSTDNTSFIVQKFDQHGVRYHYQDNASASAARNTGQNLATGDYLCFLDSDDLLMPSALAELEKALDADPNAVLAYCRAQVIDAHGNIVSSLHKPVSYHGNVWRALVKENFVLSPGAALIRRSSLKRTEPWDVTLRCAEDWDMFLRLAEIGPFVCVPKPLFQYRFHGQNKSSNVINMRYSTKRKVAKLFKRHWSHPEHVFFLTLNYLNKSMDHLFLKISRKIIRTS